MYLRLQHYKDCLSIVKNLIIWTHIAYGIKGSIHLIKYNNSNKHFNSDPCTDTQ